MRNLLKTWLADNTVTDENNGDKILVLESASSLTPDNVLGEMKKEDTRLFRMVPQFKESPLVR